MDHKLPPTLMTATLRLLEIGSDTPAQRWLLAQTEPLARIRARSEASAIRNGEYEQEGDSHE